MVTALPGGAADKAGNSYEHLWTVLRLAELLEGTAARMQLEPPGDRGIGIEFVLDVGGITWGEQVKDTAGRWTLNKLKREGVLAAAKHQIDRGKSFRLVASADSDEFATLADRARKSQSFSEFQDSLGGDRGGQLTEVSATWQVSAEESWGLLRSVDVEHHPRRSLERLVDANLKRLYTGDPRLVAAELRSFCDEHVHVSFTGPQVAAHLEAKGFERRLIVGDQAVVGNLHRTLERQQRRVSSSAPSIGLVPREDAAEVLEIVKDPERGQILVLDGAAGSGKSSVVSSVATSLEQSGWFVAVVRMDTSAATTTARHLGEQVGLGESPSVLLAGVADGSPALLVVDQLDAVSTYSGRMADNFDAVDEVLAEIGRSPNIKVILVVRSIDLEADPRLRSILRGNGVERHSVGQLRIDDVVQHLREHDLAVPQSDVTLELLRTPLHLAIFTRLSEAGRRSEYRTLQDLYERYTEEIRGRIEANVGHLNWAQISDCLVSYMSDHEVLTAPDAVLDGASLAEVQALASESVLVRDDTGTAFFHESYFDYLFARSFVAANRDVLEFVVETGQRLFRRAQTRQILEHLAATDREKLRVVVAELLSSDHVRSHLKDVVIRVLRQIDPVPEDWMALDPIAWGGTWAGARVVTLLNGPGWFDAADSAGLWPIWLADDERVDGAFHQLTFAARERAERVAELVRPHVGESENWRLRLRHLVSWSLSPELIDFAIELVLLGLLDDARGPIAVNSDFWSIVHSVADDDPAGASRLTGAFLTRGLARAEEDGSSDPFQSDHLSTSSQSASVIADVAAQAPDDFVASVLPFVSRVAMAEQQSGGELLPTGPRWGYRHRGSAYGVDDIVFEAVETALCLLAVQDPDECLEATAPLLGAESDELRFLACRAIGSLADPDRATDWLLADSRNFALGWSDSPRWASRELIERHSPTCSPESFERLEECLLAYASPWETRHSRGRGQYELLSALDHSRMSSEALRIFGELQRRFPDSPPSEPRPVVASWVGPPISDDRSTRMSDEDWIRALQKHDSEATNWKGDVPVGGARELAGVLGRRAKEDPERFAKLALEFTEAIPPAAINEVLRNVEGEINVETLSDLCEHASATYGESVGRWICSAVARSKEINERLVALVAAHACDTDPDYESARTAASGGQFFYGGDLLNAGLNSTRGEAALAVASILFAGPEHCDTLLASVEELVRDEILAVRVCSAEAVVALLNHRPDRALDLAEILFDAPIDVLDARTSELLLTYCVLRDGERFAEVLSSATDANDEVAVRAGRVWAVARWHGNVPSSIATDFRDLPDAVRRGAAEAFAENVADSLDVLPMVFDDSDATVREQAGRAMRNLHEIPEPDLEAVVGSFVESASFESEMEHLIDALERTQSRLPVNAIDVCERAVEIAGADLGDIRTARAGVGRHLVSLVLRLYRQGDAALRIRCLDVIDRMCELNAYDVERALDDSRQ